MLKHYTSKAVNSRFFSTATQFSLPNPSISFSHFHSPLKQCKSLLNARIFHQQLLTRNLLSSSPSLSTQIILAYINSNAPNDAHFILRHLHPPPIFGWNMLIRHHVKSRNYDHALSLYHDIQTFGSKPDDYTFPFVLEACGKLPSFRHGATVHAVVCNSGFGSNVFVCNALLAMYSRCGAFQDAILMFDEITKRGIEDVVSWNSMISSYTKSGLDFLAIRLFGEMARSSIGLDVISIVNVLPACSSSHALTQSREIHAYAFKNGDMTDVFVSNAMIDVYSKCGTMDDAVKVFNGMSNKDVVSWNAMVSGYSQNGNFEQALNLFEQMQKENIDSNVVTWSAIISGYAQQGYGHEALKVFRDMQLCKEEPNSVTIISILSACASIGALSQGKETHAYTLRRGLMKCEDLMVENALIDMYAKCKSFSEADSMFYSIQGTERNVVTWTVMIGGHAQHGDANSALHLFSSMLHDSTYVIPNGFTISCALIACSRLFMLRQGKEIHAYVVRNHYESPFLFVANCLIDMYSKCGDIDMARKVFDGMSSKNTVSWTSLITGYGVHGRGNDAISLFTEMQNVGIIADGITYLVVLYACSHSGMVDKGLNCFERMKKEKKVEVGPEHYACAVDLLGRAGRIDSAWEMIKTMPMKPTSIVWVALLSACRNHRRVKLAEYASERLMEEESRNDGVYTLLSNVYANAERWRDVADVRVRMKGLGIKKRPGCSWVGGVSFFVGDRRHDRSPEIYELLKDLMERIRVIGYVPRTEFALHDVDDEEKSSLLEEHSEKLALCYGLLASPRGEGMPIRIAKNLRVCGDCHSAFCYVSVIVEREIVLRDSSRFHHFKDGLCSCGGYW